MRPRKSSRLTPRTPWILIVPAGRHEGDGPRNVSSITCGRCSENLILTCTRPWTRLVLARKAGPATRDGRGPAAAPAGGGDVEAPEGEPAPEDVPRAGAVPPTADGVEGTPVTGRGGAGVGTETVGAGTVGAGTGVVGTGTVGAGAGIVGAGTLGTGRLGVETVGTGIVGTGRVGAVTVGSSTAGFAAPSACAATSPRAGRASADRATRQPISRNTRAPTD